MLRSMLTPLDHRLTVHIVSTVLVLKARTSPISNPWVRQAACIHPGNGARRGSEDLLLEVDRLCAPTLKLPRCRHSAGPCVSSSFRASSADMFLLALIMSILSCKLKNRHPLRSRFTCIVVQSKLPWDIIDGSYLRPSI